MVRSHSAACFTREISQTSLMVKISCNYRGVKCLQRLLSHFVCLSSFILSTSCDRLMMVAPPVKYLLTHITFETWLNSDPLTDTLTEECNDLRPQRNLVISPSIWFKTHTHTHTQTCPFCLIIKEKKLFGLSPTRYNIFLCVFNL